MTDQQIIDAIRRGIMEPQPRTVSDSLIEDWIADAVRALGLEIKAKDASYFEKAVLLTSTTNVFTRPSDCQTILRVWDVGSAALTITGATQVTPIVITSAAHGLATDDIVFVSGVGGNTGANGTWKITVLTDDTFSLTGSVGNAAYTSGGYAVKWPEDGDDEHVLLDLIPASHSTLDDDTRYFLRTGKIVVDDIEFANALLVEHTYSPSDVDDIPAEYHSGLVAFPVMNLITMPEQGQAGYEEAVKQRAYYRAEWARVTGAIQGISMAQPMRYKPPAKGYMGAL